MGSLPSQQKRCQLCLFNRYDLHPAKKIFDEKLIYQNRKNVTINNYPTLFKSPGSLKDLKLTLTEKEKSDPHQCTAASNQDKGSVISCNICGVCGKNQVNENNGRFTITRNSRKSLLKNTSRYSEDLSSSGVSISVEDWTNSIKRNQFSRSASMQNNFYENLKQHDNASSNNNNPPYENSAIIQKYQQESIDLNRNKTELLYAVVSKHNNGNSSNNNNNNSKNVPSNNNELLYETISSNILNNNQLKTPSTIQSIPCLTGSTNTNSTDVYSKVWKGPKIKDSTWKCTKCSYAYNVLYIDNCDICDSSRTSLAQQQQSSNSNSNKNGSTNNNDNQSGFTKDNFNNNSTSSSKGRSTQGFDETCFPTNNRIPPMASFEQDLEDDFQFLPADSPSIEEQLQNWTCKKCTLVNSGTATVCIVCGGSKLKSTTAVEDMTLRKGEFWACSACTLKNSLGTNICVACKAIRPIPNITKPSNFRPYTGSSPSSSNPTTPACRYDCLCCNYGL